jgi:hypothetical protein
LANASVSRCCTDRRTGQITVDRRDYRRLRSAVRRIARGRRAPRFSCHGGLRIGESGLFAPVLPLEFSAEPLAVKNIKALTWPSTLEFRVEGAGIEGIQVQMFNLAGRTVLDEASCGNVLQAYGLDTLANGVYLYVVGVRGWDGSILRSEARKLVILR